MLGEQRMLIRSDMLRPEKDIGDNNPIALHYGILVVWAQSNSGISTDRRDSLQG